jgi:serine/threonine protein kinase
MPDARSERLQRLFTAACELPETQRRPFVENECANDPALRDRVLALLAQAGDDSFLQEPVPAAVRRAPVGVAVGEWLGPYRLVRAIGEGGFGTVFEAVQQAPVARTVAVKVLKPGMDTAMVVARFEQERQALACMDHPHIARVLDAGATAAGRPFFVMELVAGLPLQQHCDQRRLAVAARLRLFLQVCDAVQHAHGKGILHRDLKPSNVLVTERDGVPLAKVIDFGIAKALGQKLTERTLQTAAAQVMGTLEYMSPEQAGGAPDLDVRTDVYSLGVLLYELLTGATPFAGAAPPGEWFERLQQRIRDEEPARPSTALLRQGAQLAELAALRSTTAARLGATVRGELDWIVMKAIEKDRTRRYPTASEFAADLQRHLEGQPIVAAPPSATYLLRKFVVRHRGLVAAAAALLVTLSVGMVAFAWQAEIAKNERDEANAARSEERQARQFAEAQRQQAEASAAAERSARRVAEAVTDFVTDVLRAGDPVQGGRQDLRVRDAMARALRQLDAGALQAQPEVEANLLATIAWILSANDGGEAAVAAARRSVEAANRVQATDQPYQVRALASLAMALDRAGNPGEAEPLLVEALARQQRLTPGSTAMTLTLTGALAQLRLNAGRPLDAEPLARTCLALAERLQPPDDAALGQAQGLLALALDRIGRLEQACELAEASVASLRRAGPPDSTVLADSLEHLANLCLGKRQFERSQQLYEEALAMLRRLGVDGRGVASLLHGLGVLHWTCNRPTAAEPLFVEALERFRKVHPGDHAEVARTLKNLGSTWRVLRRPADSERVLRESAAMWRRLFPDGHPELADALGGLAVLCRDTGRPTAAEPLLGEVIAMRRQCLGDAHPELAKALSLLGDLSLQRNDLAAALPCFREAQVIFAKAHAGDHPDTAALHLRLAGALLDTGAPAEARDHFQASLDMMQRLGQGGAGMAVAWSGLARSLQATGQPAPAREAFDRALDLLTQLANNGSPLQARTLLHSARARLQGGESTAALAEAEAARVMAERVMPAGHPQLAEFRAVVAECQAAAGK